MWESPSGCYLEQWLCENDVYIELMQSDQLLCT